MDFHVTFNQLFIENTQALYFLASLTISYWKLKLNLFHSLSSSFSFYFPTGSFFYELWTNHCSGLGIQLKTIFSQKTEKFPSDLQFIVI